MYHNSRVLGLVHVEFLDSSTDHWINKSVNASYFDENDICVTLGACCGDSGVLECTNVDEPIMWQIHPRYFSLLMTSHPLARFGVIKGITVGLSLQEEITSNVSFMLFMNFQILFWSLGGVLMGSLSHAYFVASLIVDINHPSQSYQINQLPNLPMKAS